MRTYEEYARIPKKEEWIHAEDYLNGIYGERPPIWRPLKRLEYAIRGMGYVAGFRKAKEKYTEVK